MKLASLGLCTLLISTNAIAQATVNIPAQTTTVPIPAQNVTVNVPAQTATVPYTSLPTLTVSALNTFACTPAISGMLAGPVADATAGSTATMLIAPPPLVGGGTIVTMALCTGSAWVAY
jgi:hypothetical protein